MEASPLHCPTRDAPALAPPGFSPVLEVQVQSSIFQTKDTRRNGANGEGPKYLLRDNDCKFGMNFTSVAGTSRIEILKTPYHAKRPNAICERFLGSVRRVCLDHLLIVHEKQLHRVLNPYVQYFNRTRPHQGIKQQIPESHVGPVLP
jgi:transposase InsO family protein